jgi:hypothetical protein
MHQCVRAGSWSRAKGPSGQAFNQPEHVRCEHGLRQSRRIYTRLPGTYEQKSQVNSETTRQIKSAQVVTEQFRSWLSSAYARFRSFLMPTDGN